MSRQALFGVSKSDGDGIIIANRFRVMPERRLAHLDSPGCQAFAAQDAEAPDMPAFALVCRHERPPRVDLLRTMARGAQAHFLWPLTWSVAHWPAASRECVLIVFTQPGGLRLVGEPGGAPAPMSDDALFHKVIQPLLPIIDDLATRVVTHRAIRADNLFFTDDKESSVVLGECVSGPPGVAQPIIYETIENGMAMPSGRGAGYVTDDFYAFGVLLCVLLFGGNPCAGMSDEEIIASKLEKGSYATLATRARPGLQIMELLRGLLSDDPKTRWGMKEIQFWLDGRKQIPIPMTVAKAARAFEFAGKPHWTLRTLANGIAHNWEEGCELVKRDKLMDWVKRNVPDQKTANAMIVSLASAQSGGHTTPDQALARVLITADPRAPIRFRGFSAQPEAMGQALALGFGKSETIEIFEAIMSGRLINSWLEAQAGSHPDVMPVKKMVESIAALLHRRGWGFGAERCLYEMNHSWPCQSPLLEKFVVYEIGELLPTLERMASTDVPTHDPVDPHIAAFCAARIKSFPDYALAGLGDIERPARHRVGLLRMLATVQAATGAPALPALAKWLARLLSPVIESYHNRPYRHQLAQEIEATSSQGDLAALLRLAENSEAQQLDVRGFAQAKADYAAGLREIEWLEHGGLTNSKHVRRGSGQAAMLMSALLSGVTLVLLTFLYVN